MQIDISGISKVVTGSWVRELMILDNMNQIGNIEKHQGTIATQYYIIYNITVEHTVKNIHSEFVNIIPISMYLPMHQQFEN